MSAMASQITGVSIVCWTVWSGADQRKHQSSAALAFVRGIHRWPVDSPHKGPVKGVSIVCWTLCSGADQRKYQSSVSLAFVRGIHRWPVDSPNKGPVTRKMFPFDYVFMHKSSVPHTMAWHFDCLAVHSPHPLVAPRFFLSYPLLHWINFMKHKNIVAFLSLLTTWTAQEIIPHGRQELNIYCILSSRWSGDTRSQCINSHCIGLIVTEYHNFSTRRKKMRFETSH